ncbi:MAG: hypothetical protein HOP12_09595 [Candidatus Eisenbacteria bacterium]|uniref:MotA/TolQ/ExbB proton channel domain-containing protein n=1 Tax=Eiseniibacteriota bacterium TaxID=2212470 RepID=A0A849SSQ5_UNCEI|nr:hypothetical protein [Candidatus Eisenbacteria bacterium]
MPLALTLLQAGPGLHASVPSLILQSGPFGKFILLVLLAMSVYCWAIIWSRHRHYSRVEQADRAFLIAFRRVPPGTDARLLSEQYPHSLLAHVARAGQRALGQHPLEGGARDLAYTIVQHSMERASSDELSRLERGVGFLGTTGSVSPFIGLTGTVWGVMTAFLAIGTQGSASLAVVAPGIAEALITTVAGIAAAIPAVVAYNSLLGRLRDLQNGAAQFGVEFLEHRLGGTRA